MHSAVSYILLIFLSLNLWSQDRNPVAVKGVMDLRGIKDPEHFIINLNGEWEFYWMKMLRPHDFNSGEVKPEMYGTVPSYWTEYPGTKQFGYATYRLQILLPDDITGNLAIDMPIMDSSYDIYVNNRYMGGTGMTATSEAGAIPEYKRVFIEIEPGSDVLSVVINVSNYHHRRGGFWLPAKLGTLQDVQKRVEGAWAAEWAIISLLVALGTFFMFFFAVIPRERIMLYFSILAFGLASRPFFTSHFLINDFFQVPWQWLVRFEYIGLVLLIISAAWFAYQMYPSCLARTTAQIITIFFIVFLFLIPVLPVSLFSYMIFPYYPALLLIAGYLLVNSFLGALRKKTIDIIYFLAFMCLVVGLINDIWVSLGRASCGSGYLLSYFIAGFIFIQAILLLYKWIKAFLEKEKLQNELEFMNRNLEALVNERTKELQQRNAEIEAQNAKIALQNRELSDTIQLKNRIFSVVAHDLRSPVVNILYMLNLLKEKEYKEKYDTFANSSIDYAQRVIGLLENMLVWGRGQEDKIKFSPENHDLADIILTNLSIFKETADKKEISVNFTQVGSPVAFCDRDLLDIIIRNLLSNAVKYTHRKGRISIFLKDRKNTGEGIMLKICDNGCGISEEKQKRIFTSEEIESTPGTENEKGTGLGLKLCYELVQLNNGHISVESKVNEGTCFIIKLPS